MSDVPMLTTDRTDVVILCGCVSLILAATVTMILGVRNGAIFWGFPIAWKKMPGAWPGFQVFALLADIAVWWMIFFTIALLATCHTAKGH